MDDGGAPLPINEAQYENSDSSRYESRNLDGDDLNAGYQHVHDAVNAGPKSTASDNGSTNSFVVVDPGFYPSAQTYNQQQYRPSEPPSIQNYFSGQNYT